MKKLTFAIVPALLAVVISGCGSTVINAHLQKKEMMTGYMTGNHAVASAALADEVEDCEGSIDEVMWRLEAGSYNYITGNYDECIKHLERAEELIQEFDDRAIVSMRDVGAEGATLATNLNALPYRGWCRDRVMIPVVKSLAYLAKGDSRGFRVETFRIRENQVKVEENYKKFFEAEEEALRKDKENNAEAAGMINVDNLMNDSRNSDLSNSVALTKQVAHRGYGNFLNPFAIFLSGYSYARDGDWQNAVVDFERLYKAMPNNPMIQQYYVTALKKAGRFVPLKLRKVPPFKFDIGKNNCLVIYANGRSAALRQISLYIPIVLPGYATLATTAWPVCEYYDSRCRFLDVTTSSETVRTGIVADMDGILAQEYTMRLPGMITRIVLNTAVKEVGSYFAVKAAAQADPIAGAVTFIGVSAYKALVNTADTRTWEILPKEFQIAQIEMPADRKVTVTPEGMSPVAVNIPQEASSAVIFVNVPDNVAGAATCRVFPIK
ncbi:MAG: hypothetical protein J6S24_09680 [Lentisphaeria bacterium]|nr:hypothetical protein [Lentisphaeria bacterium]MBO7152786.1 hypothetical protein [Lentisphaeria bacterium]